jgi:hypothetical protein
MPSLRAHMVFMSALRDALRGVPPGGDLAPLAAAVDDEWPAALLGSEAPDGWYFSGERRPDTHGLDLEDAATWPGAGTRWLQRHPHLSPGRAQRPAVAAFAAGYFSHIGLDTWEQCQHPDFPAPARDGAPPAWFPPALAAPERRQAALTALGEAPFPASRLVTPADLLAAPVPGGFPAEAIRRVAAGVAPALPLSDSWAISRVNPLREMPDTPPARAEWEARRASQAPATADELRALRESALAFTVDAIRSWW